MGIIETLSTKEMEDVLPIKHYELPYNIKTVIGNQREITLRPINLAEKIIGRKEEIDNILYELKRNNIKVVINGIGGVGKTALCKQIFFDTKDYKYVAWINYDKGIAASFVRSFQHLQIPHMPNESLENKYKKIIEELNKLDNQLLIIIDDVRRVRRQDKDLSVLLQVKNHIIMTSRLRVFDDHFLYRLGFINPTDCIKLFLRHYNYQYTDKSKEIQDILPEIIHLCGCHTLTIELLAKAANGNMRIKDIIRYLVKSRFDLSVFTDLTKTNWDDEMFEKTISNHIQKVFAMSQLSLKQKEVLYKLSFLASVEINRKKAINILKIEDKQLINIAKKGWISSDNCNILVHACIKHALIKQRKIKLLNYQYIISNLDHFLAWKNSFTEITELIPHAEEIYFQFKRTKIEDVYYLLEKISDYFKYEGDIRTSINFIRKQITFIKDIDKKNLAKSQKNIAGLFIEIGNSNAALRYLQQSLDNRKKLYCECSFEIAECYAHIGYVYQEQGCYDETLNYYLLALKIREKLYGIDGNITAWSYNNLALLYCMRYEYSMALEYIDKAIAIRSHAVTTVNERIDQAHLDLAQSMNIKGYIYLRQRNYKLANKLLQESLEIRKKYLGKDSIFTATAYQRYAYSLCFNVRIQEAEENILKALDIDLKQLGEESVDTAITYNTYAIIKRVKGEKDKAQIFHQKAINILRKKWGKNHPRMSQFYEEYGDTFEAFSESEKAKNLYSEAYKIMVTFLEGSNLSLERVRVKLLSCNG